MTQRPPASGLHRGPGRTRLVLALTAVAGTVACGASSRADATPAPPQTRNVVRVGNYAPIEFFNEPGIGARTIAQPVDRVWAVLPAVYDQMGIQPTNVDPPNYELGNPRLNTRRVDGDRMNTFIDCGSSFSGPLANVYDVTLTVATRLTPRVDSTVVVTTVDAYAEPMAVSGNPIHCQSRGELELRVAQRALEALTGPS